MKLKILLISLVLIFSPLLAFAQEESITFTTYYPSPYGSYNQLQTNSFGVGDNNGNGVLDAGDSPPTTTPPYGDVWIAGKVGIGTTLPEEKLEVEGGAINLRRNKIGPTRGASLAKFTLTNNESDESTYDEEMVFSFGNAGDDRSSIFIGPNSYSGGKGRVELNCKTVHIENANVGIGTTSPQARLDIVDSSGNGSIRIGGDNNTSTTCSVVKTGTMRYNAGAIQYCNGANWVSAFGGGFGTWQSVSVSASPDVIGQATTDGFVVVASITSAYCQPTVYTDSNNPPTTIRGAAHAPSAPGIQLVLPVRKNDYWKVHNDAGWALSGNCSIYWLPFGG